jgi:predicted SAM-dependent methyltransferase
MKKLHLGCGDVYLDGYINVDFPESDTVQKRRKQPDIVCDFTKMDIESESCDQIRLHHVFEHFQRHISISLVCKWNKALKNGGSLILAMPDIEACIVQFIKSDESRRRQLIRHMWGSHEATWATHHEGWYANSASDMLTACGFITKDIKKNDGQWPEFIISVEKVNTPSIINIENFLKPFDFGDGMMKNWLEEINKNI